MSVRVIQAGMLDTLQDMGRTGYGAWGINAGGVMDRFAAQVGNALVGNDADTGVIEMHFPAARLLFEADCLISLTGADFKPHINDVPVSPWKPLLVQKGNTLSFRGKRWGSRCYMAVHNGFDAVPWLNSVSTNLKTGTGGWTGRALKKDDILSVRSGMPAFLHGNIQTTSLPWSAPWEDIYHADGPVFFITGNEWAWLSEASQRDFTDNEWRIESRSDRMGYYLSGAALVFSGRRELLSSAVSFGTVQALPDGGIVVLMADHQTTGGYPRVAHIASAHLPKLAQFGAGDAICFNRVGLDDAEKMLLSQQARTERMVRSCIDKLQAYGQAYRS